MEASTAMPFDETRKTAKLPTGITMSYVEAGDADGEAVIMIHGITDTCRSFFPTIEALVEEGTDLHLYALDVRGHGGSSMPTGASCAAAPERCFALADLAADVVAFMDRKSIAKAHVVGHSMGSLVGQELALTSPGRVASLVLIGTAVSGVDNPTFHQFLIPLIERTWRSALEQRKGFEWPRDAYLLTPRDADANADAWMTRNWVVEPTADPKFLEQVVPETSGTRLGTWIGGVRMLASFDHRERLKQLTVPALVISATQDGLFPEDPDQVAVRAALDAAVAARKTRYVFKTYGKQPLPKSGATETDLGHNTHWGGAAAVAADITAWVETGEPTADLPYADPTDVRNVVTEKGAAKIIEKRPPESGTPPAT
jgi:pimeloyl-ACP methyl ester carboxylesterase